MYNKYNDLAGGRTSVYISHRLASTRFCDRIILVENGTITEEGTHEELISNGKKYSEMYEIQSHYYREGAAQNGQEIV
jgi:ATP-binding cassette subfamily B protein